MQSFYISLVICLIKEKAQKNDLLNLCKSDFHCFVMIMNMTALVDQGQKGKDRCRGVKE
jgi:hypothetical protein